MAVPLKSLLRDELDSLKAYTVPPEPPPTKLDANESPWPLPEEARRRIAELVRTTSFNRYPDGRATECRRALAGRFGGTPDAYILGSGSDELIALLATALSTPRQGRQKPVALYPEPTFVMYGVTSKGHGWETLGVPLDENWQLDDDAMNEAAAGTLPNIIYYASPNNPTGNTFSERSLERLIEAFPETLHVIDEAYVAFAEQSLADWPDRFENVAVMGTLSKMGLAAIRFGWMRMHPALAAEIDKVRQPFNVNTLTQSIATLVLTDLAPLFDQQVEAIVQQRSALVNALGAFEALHVYPSSANFLLIGVAGNTPALCDKLLASGIAVRQFTGPGARLSGHIRVTVGTPEENERLLSALRHNLRVD